MNIDPHADSAVRRMKKYQGQRLAFRTRKAADLHYRWDHCPLLGRPRLTVYLPAAGADYNQVRGLLGDELFAQWAECCLVTEMRAGWVEPTVYLLVKLGVDGEDNGPVREAYGILTALGLSEKLQDEIIVGIIDRISPR